jgi:hypothetical protein
MTTVARLKQDFGNAVRFLTHKPLPAPERVYGKPRVMTGFLATLTDEQKKRVLAYKGPENVGDKEFAK